MSNLSDSGTSKGDVTGMKICLINNLFKPYGGHYAQAIAEGLSGENDFIDFAASYWFVEDTKEIRLWAGNM